MGRKSNNQLGRAELFDFLPIQEQSIVRQYAAKLAWRDHFDAWGVCPLSRHNNFELCNPPQVKYRSLNCLGCGVELDIKYYPPTEWGITIAYYGRKELAYLNEFPGYANNRKPKNGS